MKTKTVNLYEYNELSESAKDRIRDEWRNDPFIMEDTNGEFRNTLDKFCKLCDISMKDWEVSDWDHTFRINFGEKYPYEIRNKDGYVDEYLSLDCLSGKLLFRYVSNNIIPHLIKGRTYYRNWSKKRTSRVIMNVYPEQGFCPLTGVYMDCDIIYPMMKYYREWAKYPADYTFEDLMNECLESFFSVWEKEWEYQLTDEAIDKRIEAYSDGQLYFSDGTEYHGRLDEAVA